MTLSLFMAYGASTLLMDNISNVYGKKRDKRHQASPFLLLEGEIHLLVWVMGRVFKD
jgi:hypothetical protein